MPEMSEVPVPEEVEEASQLAKEPPVVIGNAAENAQATDGSFVHLVVDASRPSPVERPVHWWRSTKCYVALGCCCCLLASVGATIGILYAVFGPKEIEAYAVCHMNVCGHEGGGALLADLSSFNFSGISEMPQNCTNHLEARAAAGKDLVVYVEVWFHNPNNLEAEVTSLSIDFERIRGRSSQQVEEAHLLTCTAEQFVMKKGDSRLRFQCALLAESRRHIEIAISDYLGCGEIVLRQDVSLIASIGPFSTGAISRHGKTAVINEGSRCSKDKKPDWLGGQPRCLGTTDLRVDLPSVWLCSVGIASVLERKLHVEFSVHNPTGLNVNISTLHLEIHADSVVATLTRTADQTPLLVQADSTVVFRVETTVVSLAGAANIALRRQLDISGKLGFSFLGYSFSEYSVPRTSVDIDIDSDSDGNDLRTVREVISNVGSQIQGAAVSLAGYTRGNCICVYNCDSSLALTRTCPTITGSTCHFTSCSSSRNAICWGGYCVCQDTECAEAGACVPKDAMSTTVTTTTTRACAKYTGICALSCKASSNATCTRLRCTCSDDSCAVNGTCVR